MIQAIALKPEYVGSFNMDWRMLVLYHELEASLFSAFSFYYTFLLDHKAKMNYVSVKYIFLFDCWPSKKQYFSFIRCDHNICKGIFSDYFHNFALTNPITAYLPTSFLFCILKSLCIKPGILFSICWMRLVFGGEKYFCSILISCLLVIRCII